MGDRDAGVCGAVTADEMPGTISTGMPARTQLLRLFAAAAEDERVAAFQAHHPFARCARRSAAVICSCVSARAGALAGEDHLQSGRVKASPAGTRLSRRRRPPPRDSAPCSVSRPGSPGPAPTSLTLPPPAGALATGSSGAPDASAAPREQGGRGRCHGGGVLDRPFERVAEDGARRPPPPRHGESQSSARPRASAARRAAAARRRAPARVDRARRRMRRLGARSRGRVP